MLKKYGPYIALLLMLALHLPFLQADPDGQMAWHSRGAYTDEGLYTAQIRNYINSGLFDINQMDGFAKAPLLSLLLLPFLYLLGTHLWVARLAVLLFSLGTTHQLIKRYFAGITGYWAWAIIGLQYFVFNYSHFAMAEMMGASCIVWAGMLYAKYTQTMAVKHALLSALWLFMALGFKINYLYVLAILPICMAISMGSHLINKNYIGFKTTAKALTGVVGFYALMGAGVYWLVYYPNKGLYTKIVLQDVAVKFESGITNITNRLVINTQWIASQYPLSLLFILCLLTGIAVLYIANTKPQQPTKSHGLGLFFTCWAVLEIHKLLVQHLPARYLVSSYLCLSILLAWGCTIIYKHNAKAAGWAIATIVLLINGSYWVKAYNARTFQIQALNNYIAATANNKRTMLGTWAPTACWNSRNTTLPVWEGYFNDIGFMETHQPQAIITEVDERDAGYIFSKRGINLKQQSDSIRVFRIAEWDVAVHWMK